VLGEKMCAYVILQEGKTLTLEDLNDFLGAHEIARFKLPERLETLRKFPLSPFGKVSKKDLVAMVSEKIRQEEVQP
jgi:non-ribosomal peptide synthetase component E (peptide arylation enzyme)